ncbi:MAG: protoheme IX farnesyltransferase [Bacteroidetes bacterium]|nr:protoheme IX farnesyltransferase [Bacteroidota bacterium]
MKFSDRSKEIPLRQTANRNDTGFFYIILALMKYKVSLAVTFTAITGYIVCSGKFDIQILFLSVGVFIIAGGASALNEYQERNYDAKMERTKNRPIPAGKISPRNALLISILLIVLGASILYFFFGMVTALLGLFNIFWYNLLYTNLKRITPFAVVPGSLTGAVPIFIGWTAAGGSFLDSTVVFIGFFIFIWQIPHFWLLMLKYGDEYEAAGFPTINQSINPQNLKRIIFSWIVATSASSIMVPLFLVNISMVFFIIIFALNILFVLTFAKLSFGKVADLNLKKSFISINIYMLLFMVILAVYHLLV